MKINKWSIIAALIIFGAGILLNYYLHKQFMKENAAAKFQAKVEEQGIEIDYYFNKLEEEFRND